jgi:hypothetical protein
MLKSETWSWKSLTLTLTLSLSVQFYANSIPLLITCSRALDFLATPIVQYYKLATANKLRRNKLKLAYYILSFYINTFVSLAANFLCPVYTFPNHCRTVGDTTQKLLAALQQYHNRNCSPPLKIWIELLRNYTFANCRLIHIINSPWVAAVTKGAHKKTILHVF